MIRATTDPHRDVGGIGIANQRHDVKFQMILPVGRFAAELVDVAAQHRIDVTVGPDQHHFDRRRRFGTTIATVKFVRKTEYIINHVNILLNQFKICPFLY